ncbi:NAD(P)/FAD-dependent oxidoreductase [Chitinophaga sp. G-6-1-13]|uniref:NAD(P)/FAD-dependent oxidoreductase n=1 Tax=Chitinophaga fulva TaxID=2728842 RepID=A0A848GVW9_9BACT|nr:NAD(P)/FAD-dependent oxidoreductase [Chitinophaga fulva]NML41342.1 NAD(P)/FAD-dependent oxidoreductase [Chitinophaga fulva]
MISRRNFIMQGGLITTAFALPGALKAFARPFTAPPAFDVVIVGGSYAGLSAALALGRSLRNVLIIDSGLRCNSKAAQAHNFVTQDNQTPKAIADKAKADVLKYTTVSFQEDMVVQVHKKEQLFEVATQSGKVVLTKKLLFATGLKDIMPSTPGFAACWGVSILHCPYCHGYEVRHQRTGILGNGDLAFHYAQLVSNLTNKLTIFTNGKASFSADQLHLLQKNKIAVIESDIQAIDHKEGHMSGIRLTDGSVHALDALYARPAFEQHCKIPVDMGCELTPQGLLKVDPFQQTSVPGIYACGDNSAFRSIATAVATGSQAGSAINMALATTTFQLK